MQITLLVDFIGGTAAARLCAVLGDSLARRGHKVVLLDGDLQRPADVAPFSDVEGYFLGAGIRQHIQPSESFDLSSALAVIPSEEAGGALAVFRQGAILRGSFDAELWHLGLQALWKQLAASGWEHLLFRIAPRQNFARSIVDDRDNPGKLVLVDCDTSVVPREFKDAFSSGLLKGAIGGRLNLISNPRKWKPTEPRQEEGATEWSVPLNLTRSSEWINEIVTWLDAPVVQAARESAFLIPEHNPFASLPSWNALCAASSSRDLLPGTAEGFDDQDRFLTGLAGSISLSAEEKSKIVEKAAIGEITAFQLAELVKILTEEQRKFADLPAAQLSQLWELSVRQFVEWAEYLEKRGLVPSPWFESVAGALESGQGDFGIWKEEETFFLNLANRVKEKSVSATRQIYQVGLALFPEAWGLSEARGRLEEAEGEVDAAIEAYQRAAKYGPAARVITKRYLADMLRLHRKKHPADLVRAEELYREILQSITVAGGENTGERFQANAGLGFIARHQEDYDLAKAHFVAALEAAEGSPANERFILEQLIAMGVSRSDIVSSETALALVDRFLETNPDEADSLARVGVACLRLGEREKALQCYQVLVSLGAEKPIDRLSGAELGLMLDMPDVHGLLRARSSEKLTRGERALFVLLRLVSAAYGGLPTAVEQHRRELKGLEESFGEIDWNFGELREVAAKIQDIALRTVALECIDLAES